MKRLTKDLDKIFLLPIHSFYKFEAYTEIKNKACYQIFTDMHIRSDGTVSLCCIDVESVFGLGNLKLDNLFSIYNSKQFKIDRHKHFTNKRSEMSICKTCDQPEASNKLCVDNLDSISPILEGDFFH
jgi:radical SAM protein with 4Fe4S-binding SPASM domain